MTTAAHINSQLGNLAREQGRDLYELQVLYSLERFLDRLGRTEFAEDFVLKGGLLVAAYQLRRPTRDIDLQAMDFQLDEDHLRAVVAAVAALGDDDGIVIDAGGTNRGTDTRRRRVFRAARHVKAKLDLRDVKIQLDVSTGDPIWPGPETVTLPRLLGGELRVIGHPVPTVIAEKSMTILQRGTTSTRWRDYVDIRGFLMSKTFAAGDIHQAATAVARHRGFELEPLVGYVAGYGSVRDMQAKWSAWCRKEGLEGRTRAQLDDQLADIVAFLDPVYSGQVDAASQWDPNTQTWSAT